MHLLKLILDVFVALLTNQKIFLDRVQLFN